MACIHLLTSSSHIALTEALRKCARPGALHRRNPLNRAPQPTGQNRSGLCFLRRIKGFEASSPWFLDKQSCIQCSAKTADTTCGDLQAICTTLKLQTLHTCMLTHLQPTIPICIHAYAHSWGSRIILTGNSFC